MPHKFTLSFQKNLALKLEENLNNWLGIGHSLEVGVECKPVIDWNGIADIWIAKKRKTSGERLPRVLNIEIEHWSNAYQARRNAEHVVNWISLKPTYKASLIHLVSMDSNMSDNACTEVFSYGYRERSKRFCYDFRVYETSDRRASQKLAVFFQKSYDFESLVWQHLVFLGLV